MCITDHNGHAWIKFMVSHANKNRITTITDNFTKKNSTTKIIDWKKEIVGTIHLSNNFLMQSAIFSNSK